MASPLPLMPPQAPIAPTCTFSSWSFAEGAFPTPSPTFPWMARSSEASTIAMRDGALKARMDALQEAELLVARREQDLAVRELAFERRMKVRILGRQDAQEIETYIQRIVECFPPPPVTHKLVESMQNRALELEELAVTLALREEELAAEGRAQRARHSHLTTAEEALVARERELASFHDVLRAQEKRLAEAASGIMKQEVELAACAAALEDQFRVSAAAAREEQRCAARPVQRDVSVQAGAPACSLLVSMTQTDEASPATARSCGTSTDGSSQAVSGLPSSSPLCTSGASNLPRVQRRGITGDLGHHEGSKSTWVVDEISVVEHFQSPPPMSSSHHESAAYTPSRRDFRSEATPLHTDESLLLAARNFFYDLEQREKYQHGCTTNHVHARSQSEASVMSIEDAVRECEAGDWLEAEGASDEQGRASGDLLQERERALGVLSRYVIRQRNVVEAQLRALESRMAAVDRLVHQLDTLGVIDRERFPDTFNTRDDLLCHTL